ncbi:hypothetical protein STEG23_002060, partial [Scotinomys teguina]
FTNNKIHASKTKSKLSRNPPKQVQFLPLPYTCGGQRDPIKQELQVIVSSPTWMLGTEPGPLEEQQVLFTSEPLLQPPGEGPFRNTLVMERLFQGTHCALTVLPTLHEERLP